MSSTLFDVTARRKRADNLLQDSDLICSSEKIEQSIEALAQQLAERFADDYPIICCVMTGGIVVTGHLLTRLNFPLDVDYIDVSRYGDNDAGGQLTWHVLPRFNLTGRVVILVDDILDEGHTLAQIKAAFLKEGAASVYTVVLAEKALEQSKPVVADFVGLVLPNRFVFGYGMDAYGYWRNLNGIHAIADKEEK